MNQITFPYIDQVKTGENIRRLLKKRGITVSQLQEFFGFDAPQAIYKWQRGQSMPSIDNLCGLCVFLKVPMESILVFDKPEMNRFFAGLQNMTAGPEGLQEGVTVA